MKTSAVEPHLHTSSSIPTLTPTNTHIHTHTVTQCTKVNQIVHVAKSSNNELGAASKVAGPILSPMPIPSPVSCLSPS